MIPAGAKVIEDCRRLRGLVPDGPVIVSLVGKLPWWPEAAVVIAEPAREYRWDWLRGLEVHVFVRPGVPARESLLAILRAMPEFQFRRFRDCRRVEGLLLWDAEKRSGALVELAWPDSFYHALGTLAAANDFLGFARASKARYGHSGLSLRATPYEDAANRSYAASLAWMQEAA